MKRRGRRPTCRGGPDRVDSLPAEPEAGDPIAIVRGERTGSGIATDHIFGYDGRVRCRFRIAPDGSAIECRAIPEVSDRDLFSLFAEPVMRTILVRRGLLSFHAAALARNGRAILIMADKGAGKSTLSWALQRQGWQLLADDLARVDSVDGRWSVFSGHRQTKLTPAAARAFGHDAEAMPVRFDDPGPAASAALFDKRVIDSAEALGDPSARGPARRALLSHRPGSIRRRDPCRAAGAVRRRPAICSIMPRPIRLGSAPAVPPDAAAGDRRAGDAGKGGRADPSRPLRPAGRSGRGA